jgi:hypothetical protein
MKKLLVVLLALTVIGSFVTAADVTIGTWNRIGFNLYDKNGDADATATEYPGWGRVGLSFAAKTDFAGMAVDVEAHPGADNTAIGDTAKLYAMLLDSKLTVSVGKGYFDTLRGKIGGGSPVGLTDGGAEDDIFARFAIKRGVMTELKPIDAFFIGASFSQNATTSLADDTYKAIQVGAGYTLEGIGLVRAQYIGNTGTDAAVQAAFAFTGVEGLTVDAGAKFFIDADTASQNFISAAAKYSKDALGLMARTKVKLATDAADLDVGFGGYVTYKIDSIVIGADVGFPTIADNAKLVKVTPYAQLNLEGGGLIMAGFQAQIGLDGQDLHFGIPLVIQF